MSTENSNVNVGGDLHNIFHSGNNFLHTHMCFSSLSRNAAYSTIGASLSESLSYYYYEKSLFLCMYPSLVPRPFEEEEKGPGTQCLRMCHVFHKTHHKITLKFTAHTWIKNTDK